jgi:hypothetical protein
MVQEIGASSAQYDPDQIAKFLRASLYSGLGRERMDSCCGVTPMPRQSSFTKCRTCARRMKPNSA